MEYNGQFHALPVLSLGKQPPVSIGNEVGWTPELVWTGWQGETTCPCRKSNPGLQPLA